MSSTQSPLNWIVQYIVKPVWQILAFILLSATVLVVLATSLSFLIAAIQPTPLINILPVLKVNPRIDLFQQVLVQLPNMLITGTTIGFVYAVIAVGYTMVYGVLKFVNFAHSEIFMLGGFVGYEVMLALQQAKWLPQINPILLLILMAIVAGLVCGGLAVLIELIAYRPLRGAPRLVPLISAIGVSFFLQDFGRAYAALRHNQFNLAYPLAEVPFLQQRWSAVNKVDLFGKPATINVGIGMDAIIVIIGAVLMVIGLNYLVNGTRIGKGIRAVSQDQATASLMGINVNLMITLTFFIGGALGGVGGMLFGIKTSRVNAYVGFIPGLKAFTAAVLGGIGNITGALLGGILLGLIESFFASILPYFPALGIGYVDIFAFLILIAILIFRPAGLLGKKVDEKV